MYPKREDVVWLDDSESKLKDYYMGLKLKAHRFCPECSSSVLIDFKNADWERLRPLLAMNVSLPVVFEGFLVLICEQARMLEGVDLDKAEVGSSSTQHVVENPFIILTDVSSIRSLTAKTSFDRHHVALRINLVL